MLTSTIDPALLCEPAFGAAPWHASRPEVLVQALMLTDNGPPRLAPLGRAILPRMPKRPLASQDLRSSSLSSSTGLLDLDDAVDCPWVTLDGQNHRNALVIDIDHPQALERWQALPIAIRPILVLDPWSGRGHAIVPLASPVCVDPNACDKPKRLASLAGRLLAAALGGTLLPHRRCSKWPWGRRESVIGELLRRGPAPVHRRMYDSVTQAGLCWFTEPGAGFLELRPIVGALYAEFIGSAAPPERRSRRKRGKPDPRGRNCALFDLVRWWAFESREWDRQRIHDRALELNGRFPVPLPAKEVASLSKSIAKFMARQFEHGEGGRPIVVRGRDRDLNMDGRLPTREAQSLAAGRTNQQRSACLVAAIQAGAASLRASGERMTQAALAKAAGVSVRSVRRYWAQLDGSGVAPPNGGAPPTGHTVPSQLVPVLKGRAPACEGAGPKPGRRSLAEEAKASQRQHRVISSDERLFEELVRSWSKRGAIVDRSDPVPWPRILHPRSVSTWELALAAHMDATRRQYNRQMLAKRKDRLTRFETIARHPDPLLRRSSFRIELSNFNQEWDRKAASIGIRTACHDKRLLQLRSSARAASPELSDMDLNVLEAVWRATFGAPASPLDHASMRRFRTWAISSLERSWAKALKNAGHQ